MIIWIFLIPKPETSVSSKLIRKSIIFSLKDRPTKQIDCSSAPNILPLFLEKKKWMEKKFKLIFFLQCSTILSLKCYSQSQMTLPAKLSAWTILIHCKCVFINVKYTFVLLFSTRMIFLYTLKLSSSSTILKAWLG